MKLFFHVVTPGTAGVDDAATVIKVLAFFGNETDHLVSDCGAIIVGRAGN